jgi:hypothetical protein
MPESVIKHNNAKEAITDPHCVCYTCKQRKECSDATPTVTMCTSYEHDTDNQTVV